ncbi:PREDICTED: TRAF-type zinc finger domain-containing protein 1 [Gekko japonicus]|uniref:TRAF-type zinc finger domain-containing protein 1 n=1 Tax=Gekko japonicus TaxID=146911 RepID=A0ABM1K4T0_GEKJA|nr:PREDICTED: TRAF-type zinc finger domain-containing protein 1 [Gekko japonicus]
MAAVAEEESETELCSNCKKDIPVANFTIHEIHCSRNIWVCRFCQEPVPKSEMKSHMELEHTQVTCKCSMKMERGDLPEHEASACPLRPVACQHCDLELAFHKLQEHVDYCGTRTEQCSRCSRNVMLKDLKEHPEDCGKRAGGSQSSPPKPCLNSEASLRSIQTIRNILRSDGSPGPPPRANRLPESRLHNCLSGQPLPRNLPGRSVDLSQPAGNQDRPEKTTNTSAFSGREPDCHLDYLLALSLQRDGSARDRSAAELQREFWKNICPTRTSTTGNSLGANDFSVFSQDLPGSVNPPNKSKVETLLPCEFCEELYPEEDLILHQTGCSPASALASFSKRSSSLPRQDPDERLTDLWEQLQRDPSGDRETCTLQPDSGGSVIIPCEFCGVQLEEEVLFHHQDQCDLRPATGRAPTPPKSPARGDAERTDPLDLLRRRVRHQGDLLPQYLEEFRQQRPPQPVRQSHSRGNPSAARRIQPNPPSNRGETEAGLSERGKIEDRGGGRGERAQRWGPADRTAELWGPAPARHSPRNLPPSSYVPSFPVTVPARPRLRSEGGRTPPEPAQDGSSGAKPWWSESAYPDKEE